MPPFWFFFVGPRAIFNFSSSKPHHSMVIIISLCPSHRSQFIPRDSATLYFTISDSKKMLGPIPTSAIFSTLQLLFNLSKFPRTSAESINGIPACAVSLFAPKTGTFAVTDNSPQKQCALDILTSLHQTNQCPLITNACICASLSSYTACVEENCNAEDGAGIIFFLPSFNYAVFLKYFIYSRSTSTNTLLYP